MNDLEERNLRDRINNQRQTIHQLEAKVEGLTVSRDLFRYLNEQGIQTNEKVVQRFEEEHKLRIEAEILRDSHRRTMFKIETENLHLREKLDHSTEVINRYLKEIETLKTTNKVLHEVSSEVKPGCEYKQRLDAINRTIYAVGAPLGSESYFHIRELATVKD